MSIFLIGYQNNIAIHVPLNLHLLELYHIKVVDMILAKLFFYYPKHAKGFWEIVMIVEPDRFTEQAQEAISISQQILNRYRHNQWDCEHILLALIEQEKGVPAEILNELGINVEALHERLRRVLEVSKNKRGDFSDIWPRPVSPSEKTIVPPS